MVQLQLFSGMRPGEVLQLRPCDVDRSGEVWIYRPSNHKNEHKKKQRSKIRTVVFGPKAQAVLTPFLFRDAQAFCFTPAESYQQHNERRSRERRTPENQGNRPGYSHDTRAGKATTRNHQPRYKTASYRTAVQRAVRRAFPIPENIKDNKAKSEKWIAQYLWNPNQLRHTAATIAREKLGLETAQQVLGHADARMTEKYAEIDVTRAVEFARKFG
jgi:integrase